MRNTEEYVICFYCQKEVRKSEADLVGVTKALTDEPCEDEGENEAEEEMWWCGCQDPLQVQQEEDEAEEAV